MKKYIYSTLILLVGICFPSCDFLDETPDEFLKPEDLFIDVEWAEQNLRMAFAYLPGGFNRYSGAFLDAATDDAAYAVDNSAINRISRAQLSLAVPGEGNWGSAYAGIKRTIFFEEYIPLLKNISSFTPAQVEARKNEWIGESKTLRALYYFELTKRYGGVPLVKDLITDEEARTYSRSSFEQCVEYVVELCDQAAPHLPYENVFGRVSRGAALAVKAKMLAYAASDLYHNAADPLLGYTSGSQADRQKRAAAALADVINLENNGNAVYTLFNDYSQVSINITANNKEIILANPQPNNNWLESNLYPPTLLGSGSTFPSQNLVNAYEYKGVQDQDNPYTGKDPRFGMTVVYDGALLGDRGRIYSRTGEGATQDALGAIKNKSTLTGYYLRKFLSPSINFEATSPGTTTRMFPILRLADILLLYAEIANEAYGPGEDPDELGLTALEAVNRVRGRSGVQMPAISNDVSADDLRVRIKRERRVELAFEEQRYFDLRRWKEAATVLKQPVKGMHVVHDGSTLTYTEITVDDKRNFDPKMYYAPIPYGEIKANGNIVQNPGWN